MHADGVFVTMVEVGEHPEGGSNARVLGRLVGDDSLEWEYAGIAQDGSRGIVFSTLLSKDGILPERETCPDMVGTWSSGEYEALVVLADGTHDTLAGLSMTLEIEHQQACHFRAVNSWANDQIGGSEHVAGVMHADGVFVTMVEVGEHPEGGSNARVLGRLVGDDSLEWEYAGIAQDGSRAIVFSTLLSKDGAD
jgi:hypothetical protein